MAATRRICLIGAGAIAETHAAAIAAAPGLELAAAADLNAETLKRFAGRWPGAVTYASPGEALAASAFDSVHILTPPDSHAAVAAPFIEAGVATLVEKPLAATARDAEALRDAAAASGAMLGVNQNFVFDPAFAALRQRVEAGEIGPLRHVACIYRAPLRQLEARQFGHWMFRAPVNILLEQAVHPLSQIRALAGPLGAVTAHPAARETIGDGAAFLRSLTAVIEAEACPVSLHFAVGEEFPVWRIEAFGADGSLVADIYQGRCYGFGRTQWLDAIDQPLSGLKTGGAVIGGSLANTARYALSQVGLAGRSDAFFRSMKESIEAFHRAAAEGTPLETDAAFGAELVDVCERLAEAALPGGTNAAPAARPIRTDSDFKADVALLGGTGFIGAHTLKALTAAGYAVAVMARNTGNLDPVFAQDNVALVKGDVRNRDDVARAVGSARFVVNLAHGGGGATYEEIRSAMVGSAELVADVCLENKVERLVHVGSIASLYLGPDAGTVADPAAPDPQSGERADYARAKAETDRRLAALAEDRGLPLVLLRPGLVVGAGTSPLHSGLGFFNNPRHCVGWNDGRNPLPFVLAEDVARAIVSALTTTVTGPGASYNLAGDVRPSARAYLVELAAATGRPLRFHGTGPTRLWLAEIVKWAIKRIGGRKTPFPSKRDFVSRGLRAEIDCARAKDDLDWTPEADEARFFDAAFAGVERRKSAP